MYKQSLMQPVTLSIGYLTSMVLVIKMRCAYISRRDDSWELKFVSRLSWQCSPFKGERIRYPPCHEAATRKADFLHGSQTPTVGGGNEYLMSTRHVVSSTVDF